MCYLVVNLSLFGDFYHYICVGLTNLSMRDLSKITIAADSFKGSLSSLEVADAVGRGFRRVFPECEIRKVCIADGGEGTVEALVRTLGGEYVDLEVANPLMHPVVARYGIVDGGATAVVGTMLGIKPVMHVDNAGKLVKVSVARGRKASVDALFEKIKATLKGEPENTAVFISHGDCESDARYLGERIVNELGVKELRIGYVGPVIGSHSGPGTLALFYLGTER